MSGVCSSGLHDIKFETDRPILRCVLHLDEDFNLLATELDGQRSEERRVGKECRARWSPDFRGGGCQACVLPVCMTSSLKLICRSFAASFTLTRISTFLPPNSTA